MGTQTGGPDGSAEDWGTDVVAPRFGAQRGAAPGPAGSQATLGDFTEARSVSEVLSLLCAVLPGTTGEEAFLLEHSLQCAANLCEVHPADLELQVAGLLHDVGHQLVPGQPELHGVYGARYLRPLFGDRVADLVELHIDAKRYLVAVDPAYRALLSTESVATLGTQGGAFGDEAVIEAFLRHPHADNAVALRRADEAAKVWGREVPGLDRWVPILESVANGRSG